jgi:diaminopimelate decarboxylase
MSLLGSPWPDTAVLADGAIEVGGCRLGDLARAYGTPLYVYDVATLRARARAYAEPLLDHPGGGFVAFASKANPAIGVLRLLAEEGLGADVASLGELAGALRAGVPPERIVVHGNAKTDEEIDAAVAADVALIVIDGEDEPARVAAAARRYARRQPVAVRVTPGIRAGGHVKIETGGVGSKFGLEPSAAVAAVRRCQAEPTLRWRGLHVHLGSQIVDAEPLERMADWLADLCAEHRLEPDLIDLGGGLAVAYEHELVPDAGRLARTLTSAMSRTFPSAALILEPGRSIVGTAGVTLYTIVTTKTAADGTRFAAVDGGMSDNIRPALYGTRYTARSAERAGEAADEALDLVGKHCESGDVIARELTLPAPRRGDVIAIATTGAYAQSMSSTYNATPRPAAVMVEDGRAWLITRRETVDEMLAREV